ncbi:MAG: DNA polymerase III subunit delta [Pelagibacteraceae bacterium]|nr:DNA polymerase III subunit delta [Pelagibacteraceae bacterium]
MLIKSYEILKKDLNFLNSFLIYGKNIGLKQDIVKSVIELKEKKNIKYKQFKFEEEEIIKNQNDFFNLIFSGSLFDKKKVIFVNRTTDRLFNLISEISKKDIKDILIFFEADQLEKKSKIRNLFEKDKNLVCIACYQDNNFDLIKIINDEIKQTKIKLSTESINLLIERASGDRNNLRNEVNKLKSFALDKQMVSYDQVKELTNMVGNYQNDYIVNICLNGDKKKLNKILRENNFSFEDFLILLKIFSKKIHRLLKIKIFNRLEKNLDQIFNQIRPPIFWKEKEDVKKQVRLWNEKKLNLIIKKINEIELNCKKNHELSTNITLDFLSAVCNEVNNYS